MKRKAGSGIVNRKSKTLRVLGFWKKKIKEDYEGIKEVNDKYINIYI
jgi:hypothetical protein